MMAQELLLSTTHYEQIIAHCRRVYPKEACGLLAGSARPARGLERFVAQVYPMTNVEDSPIGYSMDPKEQLAMEKQMRQRGQRLIGLYHSHTASAAYPSSVDVSLAISPELLYVLISLKDQDHPEFQSYTIDGRTITRQGYRVHEAAANDPVRPIATDS